jgi:hypothetical protein
MHYTELMHPFGSIKRVEQSTWHQKKYIYYIYIYYSEDSASYFNIECEPTIIVDV